MSKLLKLPIILWKHYKDEEQAISDQKWLDITFFPLMTIVIPSFFFLLVIFVVYRAMGSDSYVLHHKQQIADMWVNKLITYIQESFFPKHYYTTLK